MDKVIIIDNLPENFKLQPNNGIGIKTWIDDINDTQLFDLMKIMKGHISNNLDIVNYKVPDVRTVIKKINDDLENLKIKNPLNPYAEIVVQQII